MTLATIEAPTVSYDHRALGPLIALADDVACAPAAFGLIELFTYNQHIWMKP